MVDKFKIQDNKIPNSISHTIRFKPDLYERLQKLSKTTGVSFNKIVHQSIEYALDNLEEPNNNQ